MRSNGVAAGIEHEAGKAEGSLWMPLAVIALTTAIFTSAIFLMTGLLREKLHEGILNEDGKVLQAAAAAAQGEGVGKADSEQERLLALLDASKFREDEVFAIRIFDRDGKFVIAFPTDLKPTDLAAVDLEKMRAGEAAGHFEPRHDISVEFQPDTHKPESSAVLRAIVPIFADGKLTRAAEFLLVGDSVDRQLRGVDHYLNRSAFWFCLAGNLAIAIPLAMAFKRLHRSNRLLAQRTATLLRANHELTLAAKTSAVGAVAAHLIHGLKNPLFGLQAFVAGKHDEHGDSDWQAAADSTRKMQAMIADVVRILREEDAEQSYELSIAEAMSILENKVAPMAAESSIKVAITIETSGSLANRDANLLILALSNLAQNAIQASKSGSQVDVRVKTSDHSIVFEVTDQAGGLPERIQKNLFMPCQSSKAGGTGLGLAITKQLASHLGGQIELVSTNATGTTFRLSVPRALLVQTESATSTAARLA